MKRVLLFFIFILSISAARGATQETIMSIAIQPASSIISNGESVYPNQSGNHQFQAGEGGVFDFANPDGSFVKITFFNGATQTTLDFFIDSYEKNAVIASRPLPVGRDVVGGLIYNMRTFEGVTQTLTFDNPFSMTVGYSEAQIGGLDENSLNIYFWNENSDAWETFATSALNTVDNTIAILSNHLTLFATLGEIHATSPAAGTTVSMGEGGIIAQPLEKQKEIVKNSESAISESAIKEKEIKISEIPKIGKITAPIKKIKSVQRATKSAPAKEVKEEKVPQELLDIDFQLEKETSQKGRDNTPIIIGASAVAMSILAGVYILRKR